MSAFWATCPQCGQRYFHMFVGTQLIGGHTCTPRDTTPKLPKIGKGL